ncbi:hypothetical protein IG631_12638 [Alternaria alternata]|nr:hypothetical protein IG631_12638 [Alternaria alternata]
MPLGSAIYYWCGQKTPQPTWQATTGTYHTVATPFPHVIRRLYRQRLPRLSHGTLPTLHTSTSLLFMVPQANLVNSWLVQEASTIVYSVARAHAVYALMHRLIFPAYLASSEEAAHRSGVLVTLSPL